MNADNERQRQYDSLMMTRTMLRRGLEPYRKFLQMERDLALIEAQLAALESQPADVAPVAEPVAARKPLLRGKSK